MQKLGVAVFRTPKAVKHLVNVAADTSKALIEGRSVGKTLALGGVNIPASLVGDGTKKLFGPLMHKVAVPVLAKVIGGSSQVLAKLPAEVGTEVLVDRAKKAAQSAIHGGGTANFHAEVARSPRPSLGDVMSVEDDLLLKFAVIDRSKGIGHSWW